MLTFTYIKKKILQQFVTMKLIVSLFLSAYYMCFVSALSERVGSVEELGQRVADVVVLYELNGALPPLS